MEEFTLLPAEELREEDEGVERLLDYIDKKTGGTRLPKRADINPVDLKDLLPEICFFTPVYDDGGCVSDVIVTLQGTKAANFYGEHTGKSVLLHPSPEVGRRILTSVVATVQERRPNLALATSLSQQKDYLTVKALYIPMAEDGKVIDRLLVFIRVFRKPFLLPT